MEARAQRTSLKSVAFALTTLNNPNSSRPKAAAGQALCGPISLVVVTPTLCQSQHPGSTQHPPGSCPRHSRPAGSWAQLPAQHSCPLCNLNSTSAPAWLPVASAAPGICSLCCQSCWTRERGMGSMEPLDLGFRGVPPSCAGPRLGTVTRVGSLAQDQGDHAPWWPESAQHVGLPRHRI
jgi:hypothetical protein